MKIFTLPSLILAVSSLLLLTGCDDPDELKVEVPATAEATQVFQVRGVVQELSAEDPKRVVIDHEEMPGYMGAMIMPFRAKDPAELEGLAPGDVVTFEYHVQELQSWIEQVRPTGEKGEVKVKGGGDGAAASAEEPDQLLAEGDLMPDYGFTDETGADLKLSDLRGMPVGLTFVFSRCPMPEYCPAMMRNFEAARRMLEEDPEAPEAYRLLTISFDTENDTPEVMKSWGAAFGHQTGQPWSLLTSDSCCTINEIGANVGLKFGEVNGSLQHNLRTVVLDGEGRVRRIFTDETWEPEEFVAEIKAAGS